MICKLNRKVRKGERNDTMTRKTKSKAYLQIIWILNIWMKWLFLIWIKMRCYNVLSSNFGSVEPIVVPLVKVVAKRPMVWKLWLLLFMFDVLGWHIMHCAHCNNFSLFQTILVFIKWKKNWSIFYFVPQKVWGLNSTILESQVHGNFKILCHTSTISFYCNFVVISVCVIVTKSSNFSTNR